MQLYVEGYLQAMLDTIYKQEYLRVRVIDDQVMMFVLYQRHFFFKLLAAYQIGTIKWNFFMM